MPVTNEGLHMDKIETEFEGRVKAHYLEERGEVYHLQKRKLNPELIPWVAKLRAEKFQPYINPNESVFEYGAGAGWNLMDLNCKSKAAYDLSSLNKKLFESNSIQFYEQESQIPNEGFDVTICNHVLEHVPFPGVTLTALRNSLKPDGRLILVVPLEEQRSPEYNPKDREGHLYAWTPQTLGNLVDRAGFKIKEIKVVWRGYDRFAAELSRKLKLGEIGFRFLRKAAQTIKTDREIILIATKA
jgi:SAM-dependent methyltransferase